MKQPKNQITIPIIKRVIMEKNGQYYNSMPIWEYKNLYPGKWKCGKCGRGNIRPLIGLYDAPKCKVCKAWVRDIQYNDTFRHHFMFDKVFRYSYEPV